MDSEKSYLVLPKRFGWGWRLNWKHRFAIPFFIGQITLVALPVWTLRHYEAPDAVFGAGCLFVFGLSTVAWVLLARHEV